MGSSSLYLVLSLSLCLDTGSKTDCPSGGCVPVLYRVRSLLVSERRETEREKHASIVFFSSALLARRSKTIWVMFLFANGFKSTIRFRCLQREREREGERDLSFFASTCINTFLCIHICQRLFESNLRFDSFNRNGSMCGATAVSITIPTSCISSEPSASTDPWCDNAVPKTILKRIDWSCEYNRHERATQKGETR